MSFLIPHLHSGLEVNQAILEANSDHQYHHLHQIKKKPRLNYQQQQQQQQQQIIKDEPRLIIIRFGHDWNATCMFMDEVLASVADKIKNMAAIYAVDITEVPDFNVMYQLYDPCTVMFFFRNKHIMIDLGTGNNNKINWAMRNKQEFIDIVETVYRDAKSISNANVF